MCYKEIQVESVWKYFNFKITQLRISSQKAVKSTTDVNMNQIRNTWIFMSRSDTHRSYVIEKNSENMVGKAPDIYLAQKRVGIKWH